MKLVSTLVGMEDAETSLAEMPLKTGQGQIRLKNQIMFFRIMALLG